MTQIKLTIPGPPLYQQRHRSATIQPDKKTITEADAAAVLAISVARRAGRATRQEGVISPAEDKHTNPLWSIANEKSYIAVETRASARPGFMHNYDPSKQDKAAILAAVWDKRPDQPFDEPLRVDITWYYARPKNHYRTGKYAGELKPNAPEWCFVKPDRDNADKIYLDALSGTFWVNDSRCCYGMLAQRYADGEPYTEIIITTLT